MYIHEIKQISLDIADEELNVKLDKNFAEWLENYVSNGIVILIQQLDV